MNRRQFLAAWAAAVAIAPAALAQEAKPISFGHLRGQFVYDGEPPAPKFLPVIGGIAPVPDESLVVDADSRGIANVCVWLELKTDQPLDTLAIHPSYLAEEPMKKRTQTLRMAGHRFQPHVIALWTKQKLDIVNTDVVAHNASIMLANNASHNLLMPAGAERNHRQDKRTIAWHGFVQYPSVDVRPHPRPGAPLHGGQQRQGGV